MSLTSVMTKPKNNRVEKGDCTKELIEVTREDYDYFIDEVSNHLKPSRKLMSYAKRYKKAINK